jgi:hypothetical protein
MSTGNTSLPPLSAWKVIILRLTAFPSPAAQLADRNTVLNWWTEVVGKPPETLKSQPRTNEQLAESSFESGVLALSSNPIRIDWHYRVSEEPNDETNTLPTLGSFPETLNTFFETAKSWLETETCPPVARLAFGAILVRPTATRAASYELFPIYLPYNHDLEGASDFLYQINRRRDSVTGIPELRINRLSKWSAIEFMQTVFAGQPSSLRQLPSLYGFRLELDMNTFPEFEGELPHDRLPELFGELVDLGTEIAEQGDVR